MNKIKKIISIFVIVIISVFAQVEKTMACPINNDDFSVTTETSSVNELKIGDEIDYTITLQNSNKDILKNTKLITKISKEIEIENINNDSCLKEKKDNNETEITCKFGDIEKNGSKIIIIKGKAVKSGNDIKSSSIVSIDNKTPQGNDNDCSEREYFKSSVNVKVTEKKNPELELTKTINKDEIFIGQKAVYTIIVKNKGNAVAKDSIMTDSMPIGIEVTDIEGESCEKT